MTREDEIRATMGDTSKLHSAFVQSEIWWARSLDCREAYDTYESHCCYRDTIQESAHTATRIAEILSRLFDDIYAGKTPRYALIDSLKREYAFHVNWVSEHSDACEGNH